MDINELVSIIVRRVLEELQKSGFSAPALLPSGPSVKVLAPRSEQLAARLREQIGEGAELRFMGDDFAQSARPERYILPFLACGDMADLAAGKASGTGLQEVLHLLLSAEKVEVLEFEYKAFADIAPGPLYSLYENYEKTLAGFGLSALRPKAPDTVRYNDSLVTEKAVAEAASSGAPTLMVPQNAIVTPLAQDAAKSLGIEILKRL